MRKLKNEELNRISIQHFKDAEKMPLSILLDNVRSMNNTGSIFRTADAFRVEEVFLCGITATPPHKEIHKTALGATESVKWSYFEKTIDAITILKQRAYRIIGVEQTDQSTLLHQYTPSFNEKTAFVFGNEIEGIDDEVIDLLDDCIEIPQFGTKHSFNITVSAGIVLWDYYSKFKQSSA